MYVLLHNSYYNLDIQSYLRLRMEEQAPVFEVSCEYIEYAVVDSLRGVVLQLGGWA